MAVRPETLLCGRSHTGIVRSNPAGGINVCRERCVLSGIGLRFGLITHPEESKGEAMTRSRVEAPQGDKILHYILVIKKASEKDRL